VWLRLPQFCTPFSLTSLGHWRLTRAILRSAPKFRDWRLSTRGNYILLGNYVDHGKQSVETICLILAYKIKYPETFLPLRGNHECDFVNRIEGFYDEVKRRYNIKLWKTFIGMFNCMPLAAIIVERIFCVNGGISSDLNSLEQIRRIMRPTNASFLWLFSVYFTDTSR